MGVIVKYTKNNVVVVVAAVLVYKLQFCSSTPVLICRSSFGGGELNPAVSFGAALRFGGWRVM